MKPKIVPEMSSSVWRFGGEAEWIVFGESCLLYIWWELRGQWGRDSVLELLAEHLGFCSEGLGSHRRFGAEKGGDLNHQEQVL